MNKKNKGKTATNGMSRAATTQKAAATAKSQTPTPMKSASPTVAATPAKVAPSATKPSRKDPQGEENSERIRKEWKKFEPWLRDRRAEHEKKLKEALSKATKLAATQSRSRLTSTVPPPDLVSIERSLNEEFTVMAMAEWEKRLAEQNLDAERDWKDITLEEMKMVEAAFVAPQNRENLSAGQYDQRQNLSGSTLADTPISVTSSRSSSESSSFASPSNSNGYPSAVPRSIHKPSTSVSTDPNESLWNRSKKNAPRGSESSGNPPAEAPFADTYLPQPNGSSHGQHDTSTIDLAALRNAMRSGNSAARENEPVAGAGFTNKPVFDRWGYPIFDTAESSSSNSTWETQPSGGLASQNTKPFKSSPLAIYEPEIADPATIQFGILSPSLIEAACGQFMKADGKGLNNESMDSSIRKFYSTVAEREIHLRRQLDMASATHAMLRRQAMEEFIETVKQDARSVFDGWVALQLDAEERQKAEQLHASQTSGTKRPSMTATTSTSTSTSRSTSQTPDLVARSKKQLKKDAASLAGENIVESSLSFAEAQKDAVSPRSATPGSKVPPTSKSQNTRNNLSPWAAAQKQKLASSVSPFDGSSVTNSTPSSGNFTSLRSGTPGPTSAQSGRSNSSPSPWVAAQKNKITSSNSSPITSEKITFPSRPSTPARGPTPAQPQPRRPLQAFVSDDVEDEEGSSESSASNEQEPLILTPEDMSTDDFPSPPNVSSPWGWMASGERSAGKDARSTTPFNAKAACPPRQRKYSSTSDPKNIGKTAGTEGSFGATNFWRPVSRVDNNAPRSSGTLPNTAKDVLDFTMQNLQDVSDEQVLHAASMYAKAAQQSKNGTNRSR